MHMTNNTDNIDIRAELHRVMGHLRRGELIDAYELVQKMSKQMDSEFYKK